MLVPVRQVERVTTAERWVVSCEVPGALHRPWGQKVPYSHPSPLCTWRQTSGAHGGGQGQGAEGRCSDRNKTPSLLYQTSPPRQEKVDSLSSSEIKPCQALRHFPESLGCDWSAPTSEKEGLCHPLPHLCSHPVLSTQEWGTLGVSKERECSARKGRGAPVASGRGPAAQGCGPARSSL